MPTERERAKMKKVLKEIRSENTCSTSLPSWKIAKTKEAAFFKGYEEGTKSGIQRAEEELKSKESQLREQTIRLDALKNICQAGSTIIEGMAKSLLSYDKNL